MNKAIFLCTMKRYLHWYTLLQVGLMMMLTASILSLMLASSQTFLVELARGTLFGPALSIVVGYSIVVPQVANAQLRKDGEYLSLIFTRPVTRWSYVMTKWLSGVLVIVLVTAILTLLSIAVPFAIHRLPAGAIDGYAIFDALCNALGYTALMVMISSMPHPWGKIIFMVVLYCALILATALNAMSYLSGTLSATDIAKPLAVLGQYVVSLFAVSIDSYHILNSAVNPLANFVIFISNIVLYLTISVYIMSIREFFYAND